MDKEAKIGRLAMRVESVPNEECDSADDAAHAALAAYRATADIAALADAELAAGVNCYVELRSALDAKSEITRLRA